MVAAIKTATIAEAAARRKFENFFKLLKIPERFAAFWKWEESIALKLFLTLSRISFLSPDLRGREGSLISWEEIKEPSFLEISLIPNSDFR